MPPRPNEANGRFTFGRAYRDRLYRHLAMRSRIACHSPFPLATGLPCPVISAVRHRAPLQLGVTAYYQ